MATDTLDLTTEQQLGNPFLKKTGTGTTELDLEGLGTALTQTAERVSQPITGPLPSLKEAAGAAGISRVEQRMGNSPDLLQLKSALGNAKGQMQSLQTQATNQAEALKAKGAVAMDSVQRLEQLQSSLTGVRATGAAAWQEAMDKSNESVAASNQRMSEVMGRLDTMIADVSKGMDFAKAHAIQSTAMGTLQAMTEAERNTVAQFGRNSPEHMDFVARKTASLQQSISGIHDAYMQLAAGVGTSMTATWGTAATTMATLVNYQEKGMVDVYAAAAQALPMYELQTAQLTMQIEQYKAMELNDMVDSMAGAAVLRYDSLSVAQLISDLAAARKAEQKTVSATLTNVPAHWSSRTPGAGTATSRR